ncbi:DEAD/DEAH box helicase [Terrimonas sp. NA20]|uniref:DEAD/DEAH box helicase n=1 Tax=Terrimonas ginsenosidimutans TaxID=2908004 RepID=A0ABS9KRQ0_9BACT|nr:DEAD/DEAH box helicase [Terrimonas ginsenosidimutans]MCG2614972.1 DEAD/DEAH box helicase [Terrimonas ginsenosidimutans]
MKTKETTKPALLLSPHRLLETSILLQTLRIIKNNTSLNYEVGDMNTGELKNLFPEWPKEVLVSFREFGREAIDETRKAIRQKHTKQKAGMPFETYSRQALLRHYHQLFEKVKPFAPLAKWYHTKQLNGNKHYSTAPCSFSTFRPRLQFSVEKNGAALELRTLLELNCQLYPIETFFRQFYFLESNNEYFLLSFRDYQTLEWLQDQKPQQYSTNPAALAENILSHLEKDYPVNRNNLFDLQEIESLPVNRVLLSELSNTFLMLTPQWLYEGFVVDGPYQESLEILQNGEAYKIKRNKEQEQQFLQLLESLHPNFPKQANGYYYLSFADAQKKQWFLKTYHQLLTSDIELIGMDMLKHFRFSTHQAETSVKVLREEESKVVLGVSVTFGKEEVVLTELQKILWSGQRAVLLKDGSLGILGDPWLNQYGAIIKHGKVNKKEVTIARWMAITEQNGPGEEQVLGSSFKKEWWQRWQTWQSGGEQLFKVPAMINANLRPYQQKGYEWMRLLSEAGAGGCLADDMGLGKTLQAICFLVSEVEKEPTAKHIIICPSSLIYNWQQELEKFAPSVKTTVYHGGQRKTEQLQDGSVQVVITSYGTFRADAGNLLAIEYGAAIIDESHNIKNPSAQITKTVSTLQANNVFALSGTPVVNNTFDLYSQLNVVLPGMFGSREFFKREYADAIDKFGDEYKIQALQKLTAPFILRRTKEQVAVDLPEKTESILWCHMPAGQRELYEHIKSQVRSSLFLDISKQGFAKSKLAVIQGILKLRQICNSPLLLPEEERQPVESVKTKLLMDELSNILPAHKALVFSQFSSMLDILAEECDKAGIKYYHFDGQTPPLKRAEMVNAFQEEGNDVCLFLISLKAGNAGLTLTAADYVFLFDPWWNTAVQQQAIDRTHRIGQTKSVFAYKMICKDTIEEKIIRLQEKKKQLAEDLVSADEGFVKALNEEDIAYLFA